MQHKVWLVMGLSLVFCGCTKVQHTADLEAKTPHNATTKEHSSLVVPPGFHSHPPKEVAAPSPAKKVLETPQTPEAKTLNQVQEEKALQPASVR